MLAPGYDATVDILPKNIVLMSLIRPQTLLDDTT